MQNVLLVVHIFACIALVVVVLLQRSEGGALGIGGGGGGMMSGRGAAGALVRSTMLFGGIILATSLALTTIANRSADNRTDVEIQLEQEEGAVPLSPIDALDPTAPLLDAPLDAPTTETPTEPTEPSDPLAEDPQ